MNKRLTIDDLLPGGDKSDEYDIEQGKDGKPRILRNGENIRSKRNTEAYINETELKAAAAQMLSKLPRCELFKTDNVALRVKGGVRVKSREPGIADQHLCIRGLFVALEAKMPGKDLDPKLKQPEYRDKVHRGQGIHITYHSLYELVDELKKHKLVSQRFEI